MQRGEVRLIDLDPARGSEANKRRPGIVVSNDRANATADRLGRGVVTVVPVTSNIARVFAFQVLLRASATGLRVDSKAQAEQVRSDSRTDRTSSGPYTRGDHGGGGRGPPPTPAAVAQEAQVRDEPPYQSLLMTWGQSRLTTIT
jgi:mRNA interferase MazF